MEAPGEATLVGRPGASDQDLPSTDGQRRPKFVSRGRLGASKDLAAMPLRFGASIAGHHSGVPRAVSTPVHTDQNLARPSGDGTSEACSVGHDGRDRHGYPDLVDVDFDDICGGELIGEKSRRDGKSMGQGHLSI